MNRINKRNFLKLVLLGGAILLVIYAIFRYIETPRDTHRVKTQASLSSNELMSILSSRVDTTFNQYIDKAIEIESVITDISMKDGVYTILLRGDDKDTFVICQMQKNQNVLIKDLHTGDPLVIKGVFKGFLKDAILLNCVVTD